MNSSVPSLRRSITRTLISSAAILVIAGSVMGLFASVEARTVLSTGEDVAKYVDNTIEQHKVTVFSKSYCPYCRMAKQLLFQMRDDINSSSNNSDDGNKIAIHVHVLELDQLNGDQSSDGPIIQQYLMEKTGQRTVPNIFINNQHIGGNSDLQNLHSMGKLKEILMSSISSTTNNDKNDEL